MSSTNRRLVIFLPPGMTDEADNAVVLAELQVAPFRECNNQRLSPWE